MISVLSDIFAWQYQHIIKSGLFLLPADFVHENMVALGEAAFVVPGVGALTRLAWRYDNPRLSQEVFGLPFRVPLGLAAGFDYEARLARVGPALGMGWQTMGTVTLGAYPGNSPPMLGRLPQSRSLWVNKGFKSPGARAIHQKLAGDFFAHPVGLSVGATNRPYHSLAEQIDEYEQAFRELEAPDLHHAYYELNISCPNLKPGSDFNEPDNLSQLLRMVDGLNLKRPVLIKMPIEISPDQVRDMLRVILGSSLAGIIIGNLAKNHDNPAFFQTEVRRYTKGGFSGKPTQAKSNALIAEAYRFTKGRLPIVGCGGIFSAADAIEKIELGATLLQFITGMVYQGPQVVGQIHRELIRELDRRGYAHISEAIGRRSTI